MKGTKKSAAGRLFYTFGTILLLTVITICSINFSRNGRVFEMSLLSAVTGTTTHTTSGAVKNADDYKTIKYKKPVTKSTTKSASSGGSKSGGKKAALPSPKPTPPVDP